jgi:hypothetical protein
LAFHADGGAVLGGVIPPQSLFELGGNGALPAYHYKEFAGDRAALLRSFASYTFPIWRTPRPLPLLRGLVIPGLSPGIAAGVQAGWTGISSNAARVAVNELGMGWSTVPVSQETNGVRGSLGFGLTFLGGVAHAGVARPIDHTGPWRFVWGFGQSF